MYMYVEFIYNAEYLCSMELTVNEVKEQCFVLLMA